MSRSEVADLLARHDSLSKDYDALAQQVAWLKREVFGPKSERRVPVPAAQLSLGELDVAEETAPDSEVTIPEHKRRKRRERRFEDKPPQFDPSVEVKTVQISDPTVPPEERDKYTKVGEKVSFTLVQRPGAYYVVRYEREVLKRKDDGQFSCPPAPSSVLEGSRVDVSFLAGMVVDKLAYHMPLYRQHQRLKALGIHIGRSTLTSYFQRVAELVEPIYEAQLASVLESDVLAMDETPIKAGRKKQRPPGRGRMKLGYFWPVYGDRDEVVFPFAETRAYEVVSRTLKEFCGKLLADGYEAYERYAAKHHEVQLANCWSHARRRFLASEPVEASLSAKALEQIRALYEVEEACKDLSLDARLEHRQRHSLPIVNGFFEWLTALQAERALLPTDLFTRAMAYALDREHSLRVFVEHPGVQLDTNHLERAIRQIAMGRKNWLFCCVPQKHKRWNHRVSVRLCEAVEEMTVGPSKSVVRNRLQTTPSGWH